MEPGLGRSDSDRVEYDDNVVAIGSLEEESGAEIAGRREEARIEESIFAPLLGIFSSAMDHRGTHDDDNGDDETNLPGGPQSLTQMFGSLMSNTLESVNEVEIDGKPEEICSGIFARTNSLNRLITFSRNNSLEQSSSHRGWCSSEWETKALEHTPMEQYHQVLFSSEGAHLRTVNRAINAAIASIATLVAILAFACLDFKHWNEWSMFQIVKNTIVDNWTRYVEELDKHPVLAKMCISGVVYSLGDWIAQCYEGEQFLDISRSRVLRSGLVGFSLHGSLSHYYYHLCEWLFPFDTWWVVPLKVAFDQTIWSGFWNSTYYIMLGLLRFESPFQIYSELGRTFIPLITAGWKLWPMAHIITYGVIPVEQRLLWVDIVELLWVTILSMYSNEKLSVKSPTSGHHDQGSIATENACGNNDYSILPDIEKSP